MARANNTPIQEEAKKIIKGNLERLMNARGMTQVELSDKTGIPKQTINGYVKGTSLPTPGNTQKLADAFNVSKEEVDPRFISEAFKNYNSEGSNDKLKPDEYAFFEQLMEKAMSLDETKREKFFENVRFAVEFFDKRSN